MLGLANVRPLGMLKQEAGDRPGNLGWFRQRWVGGCLTIEWEQQQRLHVQASVQKYKGSVGTPGLYAWWLVCLSLCSWKQWVINEFHISRLQPPLIQVNSWWAWRPMRSPFFLLPLGRCVDCGGWIGDHWVARSTQPESSSQWCVSVGHESGDHRWGHSWS